MLKRTFLILALCTLLAIPIWLLWISPYLTRLPTDFYYEANTLSLDNFYNRQFKKFEGEHISKTLFSYRVIANDNNYLIIKNIFTVRSLSDKPIFAATRLYNIDPYNLNHVVTASSQRTGYLFGPRFENKKDFIYWHVNYNAPATMKYDNTEKINGLTVYHYVAHYEADQTENLRHLPDVPNKYGIRTFIKLELWLEPISGWLVKYEDHATAYYYDRLTGKLAYPWNEFSNRYTPTSIDAQVLNAKQLKYNILATYFAVPILLLLLSMLFLYLYKYYFDIKKNKIGPQIVSLYKQYGFSILITLIVIACFFSINVIFWPYSEKSQYKIGISTWNNSKDFQETIKGFKDGLKNLGFVEGKNIIYYIKNPNDNIENQINIIQEFIDNKVDLIFTLTTPGTLIAKDITNDIPIVFSEVAYPVETNIIQSTNCSKNNLVGTRNYLPAALTFYQLDKLYSHLKTIHYIHQQGDPDDEIQFFEYKNLLKDRNINVISLGIIDQDDLKQKLNTIKTDAIILSCDSLIQSGGSKWVIEFALKNKIPILTCDKNSVVQGALIGYFTDHYLLGKMSARKAAYILKGAEPQWLFTDAPSQGRLIINKKTANVLRVKLNEY